MRFLKNIWKQKIKAWWFFGSATGDPGKFLSGTGESEILDSSIRIKNYPFEPSSVYPEKEIKADEIGEIHLACFPPTIKIKEELIFIKRESLESLREFANRNGIKTTERASNWDLITEPFLDTEFDEEQQAVTIRLLRENGIPKQEVAALREEIREQMYKFNFDTMRWEWGNLGLNDVLSAMQPKLGKAGFGQFYWRAMEIEQRGKNPQGAD